MESGKFDGDKAFTHAIVTYIQSLCVCHFLELYSKTSFEFCGIFLAVEEENKEDNVDSNAPGKGKTIDELQTMNIKQLREEASTRGISASGTKKELLERLSAADDKNVGDNDQGN